MPEKKTIERARQDAREGKAPTTQAGEFVREEIEHIREGKHGARSAKQPIAIGLSKARRAGINLAPPKPGEASEETRKKARKDIEGSSRKKPSAKRSRATTNALKRESRKSVSPKALSRQAQQAAKSRRKRSSASVGRLK
jgi:hypothetical protein